MHCASSMFTGELCSRKRCSLAEILVLAGSAGAGGMAPPASTRFSARLERVQDHSSPRGGCSVYAICWRGRTAAAPGPFSTGAGCSRDLRAPRHGTLTELQSAHMIILVKIIPIVIPIQY